MEEIQNDERESRESGEIEVISVAELSRFWSAPVPDIKIIPELNSALALGF